MAGGILQIKLQTFLILCDSLFKLLVSAEGIAIVEIVELREVDAVLGKLIEKSISIADSFLKFAGLSAAEHSQTCQRCIVRELLQSRRNNVEALLLLLCKIAAETILDIVVLSELIGGNT